MNAEDSALPRVCPSRGSICDDPARCQREAHCLLAVVHRWTPTDEVIAVEGVDRIAGLVTLAEDALDSGRHREAAEVLYRVSSVSESLAGCICRALPPGEWRDVERGAGWGRRWSSSLDLGQATGSGAGMGVAVGQALVMAWWRRALFAAGLLGAVVVAGVALALVLA